MQTEDAPTCAQTLVSGRDIIRQAFFRKGVGEESVEIVIDSITQSTVRQYEGCLKKWMIFAKDKKFDMYNPHSIDVIDFLTLQFKEGASYGTLNSSRSAISLITNSDISKDTLISRFLRGCFKKRPTKPKYSTTWDTEQVLEYIENVKNLEHLKLKDISEIVVTLLALVTAHRLQTLELIKVDNIDIKDSGLQIKITELIKTSKPGKNQPLLCIPLFKERSKICVASFILRYLEMTKDLRKDVNHLFISTIRPHNPVSAQTIGHWIKSLYEASRSKMITTLPKFV